MKKSVLLILISFFLGGLVNTDAQSLQLMKQKKMSKWGIPAANYSGITYLGGDRYAVVCDKQPSDGYYEFRIQLNEETGKIENIERLAFHNNEGKTRDAEDICYMKEINKLYIAAEDDQRIIEYDMEGQPTGRELAIPEALGKDCIHNNYGFESLTFSDKTALFWTCTENSLKKDGVVASFENPIPAKLRLQSFNQNLQPFTQHLYLTDAPHIKKKPRQIAFGVTALAGLENGDLLVLEREFFVAKKYVGSYVINKIYKVNPSVSPTLPAKQNINDLSNYYAMPKMLVAEWRTRLNLTKKNIANYEGMCLGPKLKDGRQTILLISDSQSGYGNSLFHLKDYIRVGILND